MMLRYAGAGGVAAAFTLGLFMLMQSLVTNRMARLDDVKSGRIVEFVRLKRESAVEQKKRELPNQANQDEPPPPEMELATPEQPSDLPSSGAIAATFAPSLDMAAGPTLGGAPSDADVVPLVRVSPQYPPDAMMRGVEGWVQLEFTITTAGTVKDVAVIDADPQGYFEKAAISAVKRYKYKPKIENGEAVDRPGVQLVLSFKLAR